MIQRFPEGTPEIPYPHKIVRWKDGRVTMWVEIPPDDRTNLPVFAGWEVYFIGFHGYERPMSVSYRPLPASSRPEWRQQVRDSSPVLYAIGRCIEDRESLDEAGLDRLWQMLAEDEDYVWSMVGPAIDMVEDIVPNEVTV